MSTPTTRPHDIFATTRWTVVLAAGQSNSACSRSALGELCQTYWYPLYAYARRRGHAPDEAEDLTQGFFERLLRLNSLNRVNRENGKFRAFLLASMKHYLADRLRGDAAWKRGARRTVSLDTQEAEGRYRSELTDPLTPERHFERQWALTLLETVVRRLRDEYEADGRGALFMGLRFAITGAGNDRSYSELAACLKLSPEAVRVAVHRLRQRYRQVLRDEIAQTVSNPSEIAAELNCLRAILSSS